MDAIKMCKSVFKRQKEALSEFPRSRLGKVILEPLEWKTLLNETWDTQQ